MTKRRKLEGKLKEMPEEGTNKGGTIPIGKGDTDAKKLG